MTAVVFFDGDCAVCNASVRYIFARDAARLFRSTIAQRAVAIHYLSPAMGHFLTPCWWLDGLSYLSGAAAVAQIA